LSERQREGETSRSLQAFLLFVKNSQPLTVDLLVGEERAVVGRREHEYLFLLLWKEGKRGKKVEQRGSRLSPTLSTLHLSLTLSDLFVLAVGQDQVPPERALLGSSLLDRLEAVGVGGERRKGGVERLKCEVQVSVELRVVWEPFNSESIRSLSPFR